MRAPVLFQFEPHSKREADPFRYVRTVVPYRISDLIVDQTNRCLVRWNKKCPEGIIPRLKENVLLLTCSQ